MLATLRHMNSQRIINNYKKLFTCHVISERITQRLFARRVGSRRLNYTDAIHAAAAGVNCEIVIEARR